MKSTIVLWLSCLLAAAAPLWQAEDRTSDAVRAGRDFPGWPELFAGKPWIRIDRPEQWEAFSGGFRGRTAVFRQDDATYVLRWIDVASRGVHPAADCFRARGYAIRQQGLMRDEHAVTWNQFVAARENECWLVQERFHSSIDERLAWTDVSAWYWAARRDENTGPWWAVTRVCPAGAE